MVLNYKIQGEGNPVVILHGLFGSLDNFQTLANALSNQFLVITVDLPNHGKSYHTDVVNYTNMALAVDQLCQNLNLENYLLMGHSMGGKVVMQMLNLFSENIQKSIVLDIAPRAYGRGHDTIFEAMFSLDLGNLTSRSEAETKLENRIPEKAIRQFILKNLERLPNDHFAWKLNLEALYKQYDEIRKDIYFEHKIDTPTLFVKGEFSNYISANDERLIREHFSHVYFRTIVGAGHWVHAEKPVELLKCIVDFFTMTNEDSSF